MKYNIQDFPLITNFPGPAFILHESLSNTFSHEEMVDFEEWYAGKPVIDMRGRKGYVPTLVEEYLSKQSPIIMSNEETNPNTPVTENEETVTTTETEETIAPEDGTQDLPELPAKEVDLEDLPKTVEVTPSGE